MMNNIAEQLIMFEENITLSNIFKSQIRDSVRKSFKMNLSWMIYSYRDQVERQLHEDRL